MRASWYADAEDGVPKLADFWKCAPIALQSPNGNPSRTLCCSNESDGSWQLICITAIVSPESVDRILIAETDSAIRKQLHKLLLDANLFSDCVADGGSALSLLFEKRYAVIILDLSLVYPGGNHSGSERILEYVEQMPRAERPVVVVLADAGSARSLDVEVVQIVMRKPCNLIHLADLIKSCVRTAALHRESQEPMRPERFSGH